jgi:hypothetical protein
MNENYYIYYIIPDNNFVSEKETSNNSESLRPKLSRILTDYFPLIIIFLLVYLTYKSVKG